MTTKDNVVSMAKFKDMEVEMDDLNKKEVLIEMVEAVLEQEPETIIILGVTQEGEGMMAHTPMESRFQVIGALESIKHWIFTNGLETGELD